MVCVCVGGGCERVTCGMCVCWGGCERVTCGMCVCWGGAKG